MGRVGCADWLICDHSSSTPGKRLTTKANEGHYSSVTDDFLDFRTRSLMDKDSSWSSFRVALVTSCCSLSSSSADRSSFCPLFLFWLTNCCTTKPWYFTRRACWSCYKEEESICCDQRKEICLNSTNWKPYLHETMAMLVQSWVRQARSVLSERSQGADQEE